MTLATWRPRGPRRRAESQGPRQLWESRFRGAGWLQTCPGVSGNPPKGLCFPKFPGQRRKSRLAEGPSPEPIPGWWWPRGWGGGFKETLLLLPASASPGSLLEMENLWPHPNLLSRICLNKAPGALSHIRAEEALLPGAPTACSPSQPQPWQPLSLPPDNAVTPRYSSQRHSQRRKFGNNLNIQQWKKGH